MTGGISKSMLARYLRVVKALKDDLIVEGVGPNLTLVRRKKDESGFGHMEHLATFVAGMLAIGIVDGNRNGVEDLRIAGELAKSFAAVYRHFKTGVMPEVVKYTIGNTTSDRTLWAVKDVYLLRPEAIESVYIMWKFTGLQMYRDYAWEMFNAINSSCRVKCGFTSIAGVSSPKPLLLDEMPSYFTAETLKYLYLTFSDSSLLSPNEWVFNTEAHPIRIWNEEAIQRFQHLLVSLPVKGTCK